MFLYFDVGNSIHNPLSNEFIPQVSNIGSSSDGIKSSSISVYRFILCLAAIVEFKSLINNISFSLAVGIPQIECLSMFCMSR